MIFFTSDTHIGHTNIIKFCNRQFGTIQAMNSHIVECWNKTITKEDEVYFLGDFSLTLSKKGARYFLYKLNGKKYFLKGNHDRTEYLNNFQNSRLIEWWKVSHDFSYEHNGKTYNFSLSHYPHYPAKGSDTICLFGHIHQRVIDDNINGQMLNVGVDNIGYDPISIIDIINFYERKRKSMNNGI